MFCLYSFSDPVSRQISSRFMEKTGSAESVFLKFIALETIIFKALVLVGTAATTDFK